MKQHSAGKKLPEMTLLWGLLALVLRWQLYRTGVDAKGLLVQHHPLSIALMVLSAGVLIRILLAAGKQKDDRSYEDCCTSGLLPAVGNLAAGAGILVTVLTAAPGMGSYLTIVWRYLGLAAPVCLLLAGAMRMLGKKPFFLLHVVVCLFFVVHIVTRYQLWSGHPQMQDYVFSLLGAMALMFFGFYTAALEADCGNLPVMRGMGLAAIYLCTAELARSACPALYLGGILWVLTDLCTMCKQEEK